ncbi:MAG: hypothetical protein ABSA59_02530 [Terriglobia bacterium]|jgi:hypothetical protein
MRRNPVTKLQILEARHPGLCQKVDAMFEDFWRTQDVRHMIQSQYGERLSLSSVERYKRKHWRAQRELVRQASAALAASQGFAGEARLGVR